MFCLLTECRLDVWITVYHIYTKCQPTIIINIFIHHEGRNIKTQKEKKNNIQLTILRCVYCRRGVWCDSVTQRTVRCLWWVFLHHQDIHRRHTQSTRSRYLRWRNDGTKRHRCLPRWSSTVHRRLELLYLASVSWWSLGPREVAADWVNNRHIPRQHAVSDVTTSASDVSAASQSTWIQHDRQTTAACRSVAGVRGTTVSWRWDDTWYVCHQSPRHITGRVAVCGEWTD